VPRLIWIGEELGNILRETEVAYVRGLIRDIEEGTLEGLGWWKSVQGSDGEPEREFWA
jgi:hypothetical protein